MKLELLCSAAGLACPASAGTLDIKGVAMDSRSVIDGGMFICIRGRHTDGHAFIKSAVAKGAVCILTDRTVDADAPRSVVHLTAESTRRAAALLFDAWYGFPSKRLKLIGITGTNGKTSVAHMLCAIFEAALYKCGVIGTVGCKATGRSYCCQTRDALANMTTPDPPELYRILAEMADDGIEYVFVEITSHALALKKTEPLLFEAAIFTNLTPEHLDFHESMDAYAQEKASLFEKSPLSIINLDSPYAKRMISHSAKDVLTTSIACGADYTAEIVRCDENGVEYDLCSERSRLRITCPVSGRFTVSNSMQAAALALTFGISPRNVKAALASLEGIKGRMERVSLGIGADFSVLIDYAHTPDALEKLLCTVREMKKDQQRIVLLFGCGGDRDQSKRAVMGRIASAYADYVIVTSDNSRGEMPERIIGDILRGIDRSTPHMVITDRKTAIEYAVLTANRGDILLLAGKGHEEYEITKAGRVPFCEKEIVRAAFARRRQSGQNPDATENDE